MLELRTDSEKWNHFCARLAKLKIFESETLCKFCKGKTRYVGNLNCVSCNRKNSKNQWKRKKAGVASPHKRICIGYREQLDRIAALSDGYSVYESSRPCPRGHIGWRSTRSGACKACEKERNEARYARQKLAERAAHHPRWN